jgi:hypothetical protein
MSPYNLFRTPGAHPLVCAVPEECAVPDFLASPGWEFGGRMEPDLAVPMGFDTQAAAVGVHLNGFYLFADFSGSVRSSQGFSAGY